MFTTDRARAKMARAYPKPATTSARRQRVKTSQARYKRRATYRLATHSGVEHRAVTVDQRPALRLHASASLKEFLLEGCDLLGGGLLQPYSFPARTGDLDAPEIFRIQLLSMALPIPTYALEAHLPQH